MKKKEINPDNLKKLNPMERSWFNKIAAKAGVLYISGEPGSAKTAILESIANKLNLYYIDMRLSQKDEAEVGNLPVPSDDKRTFHYAVPEWAVIANDPDMTIPRNDKGELTRKPYDGTFLVFEELNRANLFVRNAGLQLLQEGKIGEMFKFADHVYMSATGNLGEADGTDVEEFDAALNNRLIHVKHNLELKVWIREYAKKHIHPVIVSYLKAYPAEFFKKGKDDIPAFATARSWTHLSKYITNTYGMDAKIPEFLDAMIQDAVCYIGTSATKFTRYLTELNDISINDILKRFSQVEDTVKQFNRAKISELIIQLRDTKKANKFTKTEVNNLIKFFKYIPDDEKIPYLSHIFAEYVSGDIDKDMKMNVWQLLESYRPVIEKIEEYNQKQEEKNKEKEDSE